MDQHCATCEILQVHETVNVNICSAFEVNSLALVSRDMRV